MVLSYPNSPVFTFPLCWEIHIGPLTLTLNSDREVLGVPMQDGLALASTDCAPEQAAVGIVGQEWKFNICLTEPRGSEQVWVLESLTPLSLNPTCGVSQPFPYLFEIRSWINRAEAG